MKIVIFGFSQKDSKVQKYENFNMDLLTLTNRPFNRRNRVYWPKLPPDMALYDTYVNFNFRRFCWASNQSSELRTGADFARVKYRPKSKLRYMSYMLSGVVLASKLDFDSLKASSTQVKEYF